MHKIEAIVTEVNAKRSDGVIQEIKKLRSSLLNFRVDEFIEDLDLCIDLVSDKNFDDIKARMVQLSFKIQDFTLFIKLSISSMNKE